MAETTGASRPAATSDPVRGSVLMICACAGFAGMIGIIRHVADSAGLHGFEIAFFRNLFGLIFMLPWVLRTGLKGLRTHRHGLYALRGVLSIVTMLCWFWAVTVMPMAEAVALSFTTPIFATVLAAVVLHEVVRTRRWTATAVGFIGAMVILRPGSGAIHPAALVVLLSALTMASAIITMKVLARTEPANAIVTYMVLYLTPLSLGPALLVWQTPDWQTVAWLVALGGLASISHMFVTRAFAAADASAIMPVDFARLPFVATIGFLAFGEVPDVWTWIGAAIVFGSSVYIARREARMARVSRAAAESGLRLPGA